MSYFVFWPKLQTFCRVIILSFLFNWIRLKLLLNYQQIEQCHRPLQILRIRDIFLQFGQISQIRRIKMPHNFWTGSYKIATVLQSSIYLKLNLPSREMVSKHKLYLAIFYDVLHFHTGFSIYLRQSAAWNFKKKCTLLAKYFFVQILSGSEKPS